MKSLWMLSLPILLLLTACQPATFHLTPDRNGTAAPGGPTVVVKTAPLEETTDVVTTTEEATANATANATDVPFEICSPLQGFDQADLLARISNPFDPPEPGSDNPHQGVDLGDFDPANANRVAVPGRAVQAALPGRVALIQTDRFPYGTAVIIETPLDALPASIQAQVAALTPWPPRQATDPLTCPTVPPAYSLDEAHRSLYVLYAHLGSLADLGVGDAIGCGQTLGTVGQSGNALAPHLHFEARVGPAGAQLGSLAHYDVSASVAEMAAYCDWRVSGNFIWVDPGKIIDFMR